MPRARRKKSMFGKSFTGIDDSFFGQNDIGFGDFSLDEALEQSRGGPIPYIAGVTDGDQNARLQYMMWQNKSPQERFAASEMGRMLGASPLDKEGSPGHYARWMDDNSYWGGLVGNIVAGEKMPTARMANIAGVEGEFTPRFGSMVDDARYKTGMTIEEILELLRRGQ